MLEDYNYEEKKDLDGNPVTDPEEAYVIWKSDDFVRGKAWSARSCCIVSENPDRFFDCYKEVFRDSCLCFNFGVQPPEKIEEFLSLYYEQPVKLKAILRAENLQCHHPYWWFYCEDVCEQEAVGAQCEENKA